MNELMVFEGMNVEVIEIDGKVLFNPKHVGECLDIVDATVRDHLSEMDEDEVIKLKNSDVGLTHYRKLNNAGENFLTEEGVYALIFKSRKPSAQKFQKWVTKEVLPSIRKTGTFKLPQTYSEALVELANKVLESEKLMLENKEMKPKADFYDDVVDSKDAIDMGSVAKVLNMGIGRNRLFKILRNEGILMRDNSPKQEYCTRGWFRMIESKYQKPNGDTCINIKTVVFQKGIDGIRKLLKQTVGDLDDRI